MENPIFHWRLFAAAFLCCGLAAGIVIGWQHRTVDAPVPTLASASNRLDSRSCAECHADIVDRFQRAPHRRTLRPATVPELQALFANRELDSDLGRFQFFSDNQQLRLTTERLPQAISVDWIFGSGQHALTPVAVWKNLAGQIESSQLHVSWYKGDRLGLTPGSEAADRDPASLGIVHDPHQTADCFGCHATYLPSDDGRIDLGQMVAGVSCARCHPGASQHVASAGETATLTDWPALSPLESVRRCGECHRRDDQMTADEVTVEAADRLARFASVGLVQSRCFTQQSVLSQSGARLDCITCHDPHSPARTDPAFYNKTCTACHDPSHHPIAACNVMPNDSDCISCHMPKASTVQHLWFTDHWIRRPKANRSDHSTSPGPAQPQ